MTPARALLDLAQDGTAEQVEAALDGARILRLIPPRDLDQLRQRTFGHRGWGTLSLLLSAEADRGFSRSQAERLLLRLLRSAGLPEPRGNARCHGYEVDLFWPERSVVVEFDSWTFHGGERRAAFERDRKKWAELQAAGLIVLSITWRQLTTRPEWVIAQIAAALAGRP